MTDHQFQRTAQGFATGLTIVGAILLVVCMGALTVIWWQEGRWVWVGIGIAVILVNVAMVVVQIRRRMSAPPPPEGTKRRGLIDNFDDLDD